MIDKFGAPPVLKRSLPLVNLTVNRIPRDYQTSIANKVIDHLKDKEGGVCSLYTGWGKTWLALHVAATLSHKTLVIVHTTALMEQWILKIKEFMNIDAGVIRQNKVIVDPPIVVAIIHSLCLRDYGPEVYENFGFVIFDEVHHTPSELFSGIFYKLHITYALGLSATLKRADGLSKVINWFIGPTIVDVKQVIDKPLVAIRRFWPSTAFEERTMINGKANRMAMIVDLCDSEERNALILNIVKDNSHRVILLLTHIRKHAEHLHRLIPESGLYMGGMKNEELMQSNKMNVIIGTYNMASEGYDNPRLDTLILASPKSDVEQCVGRILRQRNANEPMVIDIQDTYSIFVYSNHRRSQFYRKNKFTIISDKMQNSATVDDDDSMTSLAIR
jgi:superfamily II DNA or RNA helicase